MRCKASHGAGRVWMPPCKKPLWRRRLWGQTLRTGEKNGSKRSLLVEGSGVPLSIVVAGAHVHDVKLLEPTLDSVVVERPEHKARRQEHICADKGYTGEPALKAVEERRYIPHIKQRGKENVNKGKKHPARRWVVERTISWLNQFRKLTVRYEKTKRSYMGLLELACALITYRQVICIYG